MSDIFADLSYLGIPLSKAEKDLGMPQNYLSNIRAGRRKLPRKWVLKLNAYTVAEHAKAVNWSAGESSTPLPAQRLPDLAPAVAEMIMAEVKRKQPYKEPITATSIENMQLMEEIIKPEHSLSAFQLAMRKKKLGY